MIIGKKAHGNNWYGYTGEQMRHNWVICDLPYPDFYETDPDGKGWRANNYISMAIFFKPTQLAEVANGTISAFTPQPYTVIRFDQDIFWGTNKVISSAVFDTLKRRLYVTEFDAPSDGRLLVHVFDYDSTLVSNADKGIIKTDNFELFQNYPNPFNIVTRIKYSVPYRGHVVLKVFDFLGREVAELVNELKAPGIYYIEFNGENLASGIYFYTLVLGGANPSTAGNFRETKKLILLREKYN